VGSGKVTGDGRRSRERDFLIEVSRARGATNGYDPLG
jgi:hypothetical protein